MTRLAANAAAPNGQASLPEFLINQAKIISAGIDTEHNLSQLAENATESKSAVPTKASSIET